MAQGHPGARRSAAAVRAHHRLRADRSGSPGHRGAAEHPRRDPGADRRHQLRPHLQRRGCTEQPPHAVLRDVRSPLDLPRRLAGGLPVAGTRTSPRPPRRAARSAPPFRTRCSLDIETHDWELYHIDEDYSECHNLAAEHRDKLIEMIGRWWAEAGKYNVLPIDGDVRSRLSVERPTIAKPRNKIVFYPGGSSIPFAATPKIYNRPWSITADVVIPAGGAEGVLLAQGGRIGGYSFFVKDHKTPLPVQLARPRQVLAAVQRYDPGGRSRAALRVRADRQARSRRGEGRAGTRPALHQPQAGCQHRHALSRS